MLMMLFNNNIMIIYCICHNYCSYFIVDKKPDEEGITVILNNVSNWEKLALKLGVPNDTIKKFKTINPNNAKFKALNYWRNGNCNPKGAKGKPKYPPTWRFLLERIAKTQKNGFAVAKQLDELASKDEKLTIMC